MKKQDAGLAIEQLIIAKEEELAIERRLLKIHFQQTYESLKPINLIKSTLKQAISSPLLKTNIADGLVGLASGFVAKKIITGKSHNPINKLAGLLIETLVSQKVIQNADTIKTIGGIIFKKLIHQKESQKSE